MSKAALLIIGVLGGALTALLPTMCSRDREPPRPRFAGQEIEDAEVQIDFGRLVDIYLKPYSGSQDDPRIFKRCRIVGVIGDERSDEQRSSWKSYRAFEGWLCVEFEDGRRAFTPKGDVEYFVDSDPPLPDQTKEGESILEEETD